MEYRLFAADMDGTTLTTAKELTKETETAMHRALAEGHEVLFATGRCLAEMRPYIERFPDMHYLIALSGATIFDLRHGRDLSVTAFAPETVEKVLETVKGMDVSVAFFVGNDVYLNREHRERLKYFSCDCFQKLYERCGIWEDAGEAYRKEPGNVRKLNFYFHDRKEWVAVGEKLALLGVNYASGIPNNYEVSPAGINKGAGLRQLCREIGIPLEQAIAVGDEGNDREMLIAAGLGVAVGNATEEVKAVADAVVADCDHNGLTEALAFLGTPVRETAG